MFYFNVSGSVCVCVVDSSVPARRGELCVPVAGLVACG